MNFQFFSHKYCKFLINVNVKHKECQVVKQSENETPREGADLRLLYRKNVKIILFCELI